MDFADYHKLQRRFNVVHCAETLAPEMTYTANLIQPVHRWFPFKEAYSATLLTRMGISPRRGAVILDPFAGSGTTLLASDLQSASPAIAIGFEVNPFLAFLASTKVNWRSYSADRLRMLASHVLTSCERVPTSGLQLPKLQTLRNPEIFSQSKLRTLAHALEVIKGLDVPEKDVLALGVAAAVNYVGYFRKDGRALRILRAENERKKRRETSVKEVLRQIWTGYADDLQKLASYGTRRPFTARIIKGNGIALEDASVSLRAADVDLICYSPPYLNHIDYTEVYKVEAWLLGYIANPTEMLHERKQTFRSHGSIGIRPSSRKLPRRIEAAIDSIVERVAKTGWQWHKPIAKLTRAYLEDMQTALVRQYALLRTGGQIVCVVGNPCHGTDNVRIPIAIDLFVCELAESLGFDVERIAVARQSSRRGIGNGFARESVVVLRKPAVT